MWLKLVLTFLLLTLAGCMAVDIQPLSEDHPANPNAAVRPLSETSSILETPEGQAVKPMETPSMGGHMQHGGAM